MSDSQAPWLCQYNNEALFSRFVIRFSYPEIYDAILKYKIENKILEDKENILIYEKMRDKFLELADLIDTGHFIPIKNMPTQAYLLPNQLLPPNNIPMFRGTSGLFLVNQVVYDIFCQQNLGKTHFSQVFIYDILNEEKISDVPYYFINVAEKREYLNIQESKGISEYDFIPNYSQRKIFYPKDGDILLSKEALSCNVDVWHEPILDYSLFFSNKLVQNLFHAGIKKEDFGLVQCGLI